MRKVKPKQIHSTDTLDLLESLNRSQEKDNEDEGENTPKVSLELKRKHKASKSDVGLNDLEAATPPPTPSKISHDIEHQKTTATIWRLFALAKPEWYLLVCGTICVLMTSCATLITSAYGGMIVQSFTVTNSSDSSLRPMISTLIIVFIAASLLTFVQQACFDLVGQRIIARLRKDLFWCIIQQEIGFFDQNNIGELTNRLGNDTSMLQNTTSRHIAKAIQYVLLILGSFSMLMYISWELTFTLSSVIPVYVIAAYFLGKFLKNQQALTQTLLAQSSVVATEVFGNIRTVRSFSKEEFEHKRYSQQITKTYDLGSHVAIVTAAFDASMIFVGFMATIILLWHGGYLVVGGRLNTGQFTSYLLYVMTLRQSANDFYFLVMDLMKSIGASQRVFQLLDREPRVKCRGGLIPSIHTVKGHISIEAVSFSYPAREDVRIINNFHLEMFPNTVTALVGSSGGGKSTIAHLIECFYYPTEGRILLDGVDLRDLDPRFLHEVVAIVSQEPCLFSTTIAENIAYGLENRSMQEIEQAARIANAHSFISSLPNGYNTHVGERGVQLSGGQKQRIAIARALLKDPKILLLDEATSALDSESERVVQEALDRLMQGRTVMVIAHRLSTVKNANVVCVIQQGVIAEQGTHDELLRKDGIYKQLVLRQLAHGQ